VEIDIYQALTHGGAAVARFRGRHGARMNLSHRAWGMLRYNLPDCVEVFDFLAVLSVGTGRRSLPSPFSCWVGRTTSSSLCTSRIPLLLWHLGPGRCHSDVIGCHSIQVAWVQNVWMTRQAISARPWLSAVEGQPCTWSYECLKRLGVQGAGAGAGATPPSPSPLPPPPLVQGAGAPPLLQPADWSQQIEALLLESEEQNKRRLALLAGKAEEEEGGVGVAAAAGGKTAAALRGEATAAFEAEMARGRAGGAESAGAALAAGTAAEAARVVAMPLGAATATGKAAAAAGEKAAFSSPPCDPRSRPPEPAPAASGARLMGLPGAVGAAGTDLADDAAAGGSGGGDSGGGQDAGAAGGIGAGLGCGIGTEKCCICSKVFVKGILSHYEVGGFGFTR